MSLKFVFWDLDGRIGRRTYWLAHAALFVFGLVMGPLQAFVGRIFDSASQALVRWNEPELATAGRKIVEGSAHAAELCRKLGPERAADACAQVEAMGAFRDGFIAHMFQSIGLGAVWTFLLIGLALLNVRSAVAVTTKRVVDAGYHKGLAWGIFALLILNFVISIDALPWLGPGLRYLALFGLVVIGFLPPADGAGQPLLPPQHPAPRPGSPRRARATPRTTFGLR
jgi:uncharacterized membrane protein YhaH (DUF805 family)